MGEKVQNLSGAMCVLRYTAGIREVWCHVANAGAFLPHL